LKHEAMIKDPRNKESYPYLGGDKDLEISPEKMMTMLRSNTSLRNWSQEPQLAAKCSFLAGRGSGLEDESRASRMQLPAMVQRLQKRMDADWEGTTVIVSATDQDLIQIAYHMATVDSERGVLAYMNVLSKDVDLLGSLGLRKVSQLWGMKRDFSSEFQNNEPVQEEDEMGDADPEHVWIFFLLTPKWVRMRPTDAYYTVHPRSQGSAFRMSTAGSSVLLSLGSSVLDPAEMLRRKSEPGADASGSRSARGDLDRMSARGNGSDKIDIGLMQKAVSSLPPIGEPRRG